MELLEHVERMELDCGVQTMQLNARITGCAAARARFPALS